MIRNRRFESSSLQQGVFEPSVPPHATDLIRLRGTFQIASGIFLAAYLLGHMMNCAFVFARLYLGIDSDWALATAASGLVKDAWDTRLMIFVLPWRHRSGGGQHRAGPRHVTASARALRRSRLKS